MLNDADYNTFSLALTADFVSRAVGNDVSNRRIVGRRPSDEILAGFLTPVRNVGNLGPSDDDTTIEDVAIDTPYEQTSIGMEWLVPLRALQEGNPLLTIGLDLSVFVRRLPTFEEQNQRSAWSVRRGDSVRVSPAVQSWTRHDLTALGAEIDLTTLARGIPVRFSCQQLLEHQRETVIDTNGLFPGLQNHDFREEDLQSEESFATACGGLNRGHALPRWNPVFDLRLVRVPTIPDVGRIALRIINRTQSGPESQRDFVDPNLYAVSLTASIPHSCHQMTDFHELPASFRYDRKMWGVGINCQVEGRVEASVVLNTNTTPVQAVNRLEPREISGAEPTFEKMIDDPLPTLRNIANAMESYSQEEWRRKIGSLQNSLEQNEAEGAAIQFQEEMARFRRGIDLLADANYTSVRTAFTFMNEAMRDAAAGKYDRWRLFQIVFVVSQLPGLAAREFPELERENDGWVDILWFAAGGGKTEAFLGVILWQAFFDRLRGKRVGTSALVRFPLRLLAFQQLQRISKALATAEIIRKREQLGGARFSIGDFAGGTVTPNSVSDSDHQRFQRDGVDERFQRVFECPFCKSSVQLRYVANNRLIEHYCASDGCPSGDRLPVYIVDYDIYRFLPTVIVATVDKIALLGYNQRFANIFGRIDLLCPQHGASFRGTNAKLCMAAHALQRGEDASECNEHPVTLGPFVDPGPAIMVQDELHLLSSALGAFDSHYETAAEALSKALGQKPWKVIAATATIKSFETHAAQLYLKKARQFPGPGPSAFESFYYQLVSERIGRIFVGILGVGRKHTPSLTRALSLLYLGLQNARDLLAVNLAEANQHFGTSVESVSDFNELIFTYELALTYVLTRKGSDQVAEAIESRVKSELRTMAPMHGDLRVETFNSGIDIAEMTATINEISSATHEGDAAERLRALITTNIIGHGVDVDRFNIIFFAGFPRMVAEYIQASARVGRTYPGISVLVITPQNERDRSIFDRFRKFHEYLDRLVDPSAVTRWTEPTVLKTLPGILAGYLMAVASSRLNVPISTVEGVQREVAKAGAAALNESAVLTWIEEAYGADKAPSPERYKRKLHSSLNNRYRLVLNEQTFGGQPKQLGMFLGSMQSLRDIDDPGEIRVGIPQQAQTIKNLIHG